MKPSVRTVGDRLLRVSPNQAVLSRRAASKLAVLAYHGIEDARCFGQQLDSLATSTNFVSLSQIVEHIKVGARLPRRPILVTFDDGDPSVLTKAAPELHRRGIPAVAFVIPGHLGTSLPFWWEEVAWHHGHSDLRTSLPDLLRDLKLLANDERLAAIEAMRSRQNQAPPEREQLTFDDLAQLEELGIEVGNHSYSHPILTQCSSSDVSEEIGKSHRNLEESLDHPIRAFAYPNGDHNPTVVEAVRSFGYDVAFCFDHSLQQLPIHDPLRISRVRLSSRTSIDRLMIIISGLHPWIHRTVGRS